MRLTRRHLLAGAALVAAASAAGAGGIAASWWDQGAGEGYAVLSEDEAAIVDALAEAAYPTGGEPAIGGRDVGAARYLDVVLLGMEPTQRNLLRVSLHALDAFPVATRGARLRFLAPEEAAAVVAEGLASPTAELRGLFQSFHLFVGMAYTSHPDVAPRLARHFGCGFGR
ncbi:MAG: hypothetical protein ACOZNI_08870 [Myxococcota bacterium]